MIDSRRTISQAKFFMQQNLYLRNLSVQELATEILNNVSEAYIKSIYNHTSNITGSDPYWFQRRQELTTQSNQEVLQHTLFCNFLSADKHWRSLMKLLDVPFYDPIQVIRKAVRKHPYIVAFYLIKKLNVLCPVCYKKQ